MGSTLGKEHHAIEETVVARTRSEGFARHADGCRQLDRLAAIADRGSARRAGNAPDIAMAGVIGSFRTFQRRENR